MSAATWNALAATVPTDRPLWHVLLVLALFSAIGTWALTRVLPHEVEEPPLTVDDLVTDAAFALLDETPGAHGQRYRTCAGCGLELHHDDLSTHARDCVPLRTRVVQAN